MDLTSMVILGWRRGFSRRAERTGDNGLDLGHVEGGMDSGVRWQTEADGRGANYGDDLIGAGKTGRQFPTGGPGGDVSSGEPDSLTGMVTGGRAPPPVGESAVLFGSLFECLDGLVPELPTTKDVVVNSRDGDLSVILGE